MYSKSKVLEASTDEDKISVVITAYNRQKFLGEALKSVVNQTMLPSEVILVTNFEYDLEKFRVLNIKHIICSGTVGEFLYRAVKDAIGNIIVFLDDDDIFLPDKVQTTSKFFKDHRVVYLHNNCSFIDDSGIPVKTFRIKSIDFNLSSISIRKQIIELNVLRRVYANTDVIMHLFALKYGGRALNIRNKLTEYRIHPDNTGSKMKSNISHLHEMLLQAKEYEILFINCRSCMSLLRKKSADATLIYMANDTNSYSFSFLIRTFIFSMVRLNFRAAFSIINNFINLYIINLQH